MSVCLGRNVLCVTVRPEEKLTLIDEVVYYELIGTKLNDLDFCLAAISGQLCHSAGHISALAEFFVLKSDGLFRFRLCQHRSFFELA